MPKTVLIAVHTGYPARYLLRTDVFKVLRDAGVRIVILTPNADEEYFRREFEDDGVFIEKLELDKCLAYYRGSRFAQTFIALRQNTLGNDGDLATIVNKQKGYWRSLRKRNPVKAMILGTMIALLRRFKVLRRGLITLESKLFPGNFHSPIFDKYRPDLVVTASTGHYWSDFVVMREASSRGIKIVTAVLSWDNPSSKGMGGAHSDYALAWTDVMKKELMAYLDFEDSQVHVAGVAHWDIYFKNGHRRSREEWIHEIGLDPARKTIVLGTKNPMTDPRHDVVEFLADAVDKDRLESPCQLLIRVHPLYFQAGAEDALRELLTYGARYDHVSYSVPSILSNKLSYDMPAAEMEELDSLLHHSDVLVGFYSTLTVEAAICDLPVVQICFDRDGNDITSGKDDIVFYYASCVHNRRVVEAGAVAVASDPEDMIDKMNKYLADPSLHAEERALVADRESGPNKGEAGRRVGEFLLDRLK